VAHLDAVELASCTMGNSPNKFFVKVLLELTVINESIIRMTVSRTAFCAVLTVTGTPSLPRGT
jgi:hypothetical protein